MGFPLLNVYLESSQEIFVCLEVLKLVKKKTNKNAQHKFTVRTILKYTKMFTIM